MITKEEQLTIDYYDKNAHTWVEKHHGGGMFDNDMDELFELVPRGKVLEVGVGSGGDAKRLLNYYGEDNYVGIEPARGLLKIAQHAIPLGKFFQKTIYDMDFPKGAFDAFWVCAMLIHVPKNKLSGALLKIRGVVKKGAYGFISVMEGDMDMEESRPGRYYSLWSKEEFDSELASAGFRIVKFKRIVPEKGSPWFAYILKAY